MDTFQLAEQVIRGGTGVTAMAPADVRVVLEDTKDPYLKTAAVAIRQGNLPLLKRLAEEHKVPLQPLAGLACFIGNMDILHFMDERGIDFAETNLFAIHNALMSGRVQAIEWLIDTKNLTLSEHDISSVAASRDTAMIDYCLERLGNKPEVQLAILRSAVLNNNLAAIKHMEAKGADLKTLAHQKTHLPAVPGKVFSVNIPALVVQAGERRLHETPELMEYVVAKAGMEPHERDALLRKIMLGGAPHSVAWLQLLEKHGATIDFSTDTEKGHTFFKNCTTPAEVDFLVAHGAVPDERALRDAFTDGRLEVGAHLKSKGLKLTKGSINTDYYSPINFQHVNGKYVASSLRAMTCGAPFLAHEWTQAFPDMAPLMPAYANKVFDSFSSGGHRNDVWYHCCGQENRWLATRRMYSPHPTLASFSPFNFKLDQYEKMLPLATALCDAEEVPEAAPVMAYKFSLLFDSPQNALKYVQKFAGANPDFPKPAYNSMQITIPTMGKWSSRAWGNFLLSPQTGYAQRLIGRAADIEALMGRAPKNVEEAREAARRLIYKRCDENPILSEICAQFNISELSFERCLEVLANKKKEDHIPDIMIDGKDLPEIRDELGRKVNDKFYLKKLAPDDPRVLLIGHYVSCCNHIDGATRTMAVAAVESPDVGCYAMFKRDRAGGEDQIVAKVTPWISKNGNLVLNSWETPGTNWSYLCKPFMQEVGKRVLREHPTINMVAIGYNHPSNTPPLGLRVLKTEEQAQAPGYSSNDSKKQYLLAVRDIDKVETLSEKEARPELAKAAKKHSRSA